MTALLHTTLSVVLDGCAYMVTSHIPYRRAWIWTGTASVVLVGFMALIARSVFEGSPARLQSVVGTVGAALLAVAGIVCFALFAAVARGPRVLAVGDGAVLADVSVWAPRNEEPVIVPEGAEEWGPGSVIDSGMWPSDGIADEGPRGGRYAYASPDEAEAPRSAPARAVDPPVDPAVTAVWAPAEVAPAPSAGASAGTAMPRHAPLPPTTEYPPDTAPQAAASRGRLSSSPDEDGRESVAPRRALPPADDVGE